MQPVNQTLHRCHANSPHRPPSWRWDRAGLRLAMGNRTPDVKNDDTWVRKAFNMRTTLDNAPSDVDAFNYLQNQGDLGTAYYLWDEYALQPTQATLPLPGSRAQTATNVPTPVISKLNNPQAGFGRHEIEARILAGQPMSEIAQRLAVTTKSIEIYEKIFFNVLDRLDAPSWILHQVIGPMIHQGMTDRDLPVIWKLYGYAWKNAAFLDQMVTTIFGKMSSDVEDAKARLIEDYGWNVVLKATKAARSIPIEDRTRARMLELQAAIKTADKTGDLDGSTIDSYQINLAAALGQVDWKVGGPPNLRIGTSGEPRSRELLVVAAIQAGANPVTVESDGGFKWPEPAPPKV